jgi:polygalacturonase
MEPKRIIHIGVDQKPRPEEPAAGYLIQFENCKNVLVENVTLRNAESWTLHLLGCTDVHVKGVTIRNPAFSPTTDGMDIDASKNVIISDCNIFTRDDAIVIKNRDPAYWHRACENIVVTNCLITSQASAFKIGTESIGDFRNIVFSNSVIKADTLDKNRHLNKEWLERYKEWLVTSGNSEKMMPRTGIGIMTVDGGNIQGITITNIVIEAEIPLFIRLGNRGNRGLGRGTVAQPAYTDPDAKPGDLKDVTISNIIAYNAVRTSTITGIPGHSVENVKLSNIIIRTKGGGDEQLAAKVMDDEKTIRTYPSGNIWGDIPASGLYVRHVEGMDISNVKILVNEKEMRPLMIMNNSKNIYVENLQTNDLHQGKYILDFINVNDLRLHNCNIPMSGNTKLLSFKGKETKNVRIDIPSSRAPVENIDTDITVPKKEIFIRAGFESMPK